MDNTKKYISVHISFVLDINTTYLDARHKHEIYSSRSNNCLYVYENEHMCILN